MVAGVGVPLATHFFCSCCCLYTYVGQWQKLVCPWLSIYSFKPSGVVAGVGVPLATHLLFLLLFLHLCRTVTKAGVPLTVRLSFNPKWGGSRSWCTPGHPSFVFVVVVYTPAWGSSKSWCALGCHLLFSKTQVGW